MTALMEVKSSWGKFGLQTNGIPKRIGKVVGIVIYPFYIHAKQTEALHENNGFKHLHCKKLKDP